MLGCLFCHRKLKLFKISKMHSNTEHPIKKYIVEFLGDCEQYLKDDYGMCCNCVYVLNNFLYIKRLMYLIIASDNYYDFSAVYKTFVEQLQKVNYYDEDKLDSSDNEDNLLQEQRTSPYVEEQETNLTITRNDKEVEAYMNKRKRKRGHGWTRRKRSHSRGRSALSEPIYRNNPSRAMSGNYSEYNKSDWGYSSDEDSDSYFQFSTVNNTSKSNHISGRTSQKNTLNIYSCIKGCKYKSINLSAITEHKMKTHGMLAKYVCEECYRQKFVSSEDLKAHNDKCHNTLISFCLYCSEEMRTLAKLKEHSENHPYSCIFCDLSFLTRIKLRKHSLQLHKWKRKKSVINRSIKRIVFFDKDSNNSSSTTNNVDCEKQIVKILQKPSSEVTHTSSYNDVIEGIFIEDSNHFSDSNVIQNVNEISNLAVSAEDLPNNEIPVNSSNVSDDVSPLSNDVCESFNEIEYDEVNETEQVDLEQSIEIESSTVVEITETCISGELNSIDDDSLDRIISRAKAAVNTEHATASFEQFIRLNMENTFDSSGLPSTSTSPSPKNSKISDETQNEISPKSNNKNNLVNEKYFLKQDGKL